MIVKNGGICFGACSITGVNIDSHKLVFTDGTDNSSSITRTNLYLGEANTGDNQRGIKMRLGVGTTAPAISDYDLANRLVDGVDINTIVTCSSISMSATSNGAIIYTAVFANTGSASYVIREIGLFVSPSGAGGTALLARKIIPARTIPAGASVTFSYEINPLTNS